MYGNWLAQLLRNRLQPQVGMAPPQQAQPSFGGPLARLFSRVYAQRQQQAPMQPMTGGPMAMGMQQPVKPLPGSQPGGPAVVQEPQDPRMRRRPMRNAMNRQPMMLHDIGPGPGGV